MLIALVSVPAALLGGAIALPAVLRQLIGAVLLIAAWKLLAG